MKIAIIILLLSSCIGCDGKKIKRDFIFKEELFDLSTFKSEECNLSNEVNSFEESYKRQGLLMLYYKDSLKKNEQLLKYITNIIKPYVKTTLDLLRKDI